MTYIYIKELEVKNATGLRVFVAISPLWLLWRRKDIRERRRRRTGSHIRASLHSIFDALCASRTVGQVKIC